MNRTTNMARLAMAGIASGMLAVSACSKGGKAGEADATSRDVPIDPVKGSDFALSVSYQMLAKTIAERN